MEEKKMKKENKKNKMLVSLVLATVLALAMFIPTGISADFGSEGYGERTYL